MIKFLIRSREKLERIMPFIDRCVLGTEVFTDWRAHLSEVEGVLACFLWSDEFFKIDYQSFDQYWNERLEPAKQPHFPLRPDQKQKIKAIWLEWLQHPESNPFAEERLVSGHQPRRPSR